MSTVARLAEPFVEQFSRGCSWGISSSGRAPASHAGGTRIDTRILHLFFSSFHICHWWQKTRKPLRNLKEMKLERNVTVFDTYRPFFYWIWRRVSETNMRRTFRQGKQQKTRKLHLFLLFFSSVTLIVVFGKIIAIERFPMRHDITGFWWVNALKLSLVV